MVRSRLGGFSVTSLAGMMWIKAIVLSLALGGLGCQTASEGQEDPAAADQMAPEGGDDAAASDPMMEEGDAAAKGKHKGAKGKHKGKGKKKKGKGKGAKGKAKGAKAGKGKGKKAPAGEEMPADEGL